VEAAAAGSEMAAAGGLVAGLGALQDDGDALQVEGAIVVVKRKGSDQRVGGVADLAQGDRRIFPPAAAVFGGPRRDG
jgi:hypothetical protein